MDFYKNYNTENNGDSDDRDYDDDENDEYGDEDWPYKKSDSSGWFCWAKRKILFFYFDIFSILKGMLLIWERC